MSTEFEAATSPTIFILQPEAMADSLYTIPQYSTWQPIETSIGKRRAEKSEWYPDVPSSDLPPGWMQTPQYAMDDKIKCLALDCEMVRTSEGQELARITVVDRKLEVVYDTYVQPSAPVEDYATQCVPLARACMYLSKTSQAESIEMQMVWHHSQRPRRRHYDLGGCSAEAHVSRRLQDHSGWTFTRERSSGCQVGSSCALPLLSVRKQVRLRLIVTFGFCPQLGLSIQHSSTNILGDHLLNRP